MEEDFSDLVHFCPLPPFPAPLMSELKETNRWGKRIVEWVGEKGAVEIFRNSLNNKHEEFLFVCHILIFCVYVKLGCYHFFFEHDFEKIKVCLVVRTTKNSPLSKGIYDHFVPFFTPQRFFYGKKSLPFPSFLFCLPTCFGPFKQEKGGATSSHYWSLSICLHSFSSPSCTPRQPLGEP